MSVKRNVTVPLGGPPVTVRRSLARHALRQARLADSQDERDPACSSCVERDLTTAVLRKTRALAAQFEREDACESTIDHCKSTGTIASRHVRPLTRPAAGRQVVRRMRAG